MKKAAQFCFPESEKFVIGALLHEHAAALPICDAEGIDAGAFTDEMARAAWAAIVAKVADGHPVDPISIAMEMGGSDVDAVEFLTGCMGGCISPQFAAKHAGRVAEAASRRRLAAAIEAARLALAGDASAGAIAEELTREAGGLAVRSIGGPLVSTFPALSFSQLQRLEVDPDAYILGAGFLRRGAWTLLTGGTGTGKSVLIEQLAACVAAGKPILGLSVSRPFKVLLLTAENDEETLKRDLEAIAEHEALDPALLDANLQIHHAYALDGPELVAALDSEIRRGGFDLLVLDNYQAYAGSTDINDSVAWKQFISPLSRMLKKHRAAMLLVDHTGKPVERKTWGRHDSVYLAAGTSLKANGARCSAELYSPAGDDERYKLHFGKNWERAGVVDEQGRQVRDVYLDRAPSAAHPYWSPSHDQISEANINARKVLNWKRLHPEDGIDKVAQATGVSRATAGRVLKKHRDTLFEGGL